MVRTLVDPFEAILIDVEGLDPRLQCRRWNPKLGGCAGRARHSPSRLGQGRLDRRAFLDRELFGEWATHLRRGDRFAQKPKLIRETTSLLRAS